MSDAELVEVPSEETPIAVKRKRGRPKGSKAKNPRPKTIKPPKPAVVIVPWDDTCDAFKAWYLKQFPGVLHLTKPEYEALSDDDKLATQKAEYENPILSEVSALCMKWFEHETNNEACYIAVFLPEDETEVEDDVEASVEEIDSVQYPLIEVDGKQTYSVVRYDDEEALSFFGMVWGWDAIESISAVMKKDGSVRVVEMPDEVDDDPFYAGEKEGD
jgi:hypothetical protein